MSCSEVCDKLIPRDHNVALVLLVGRVPTACCTLELEGRERDVVHWTYGVRVEVLHYFCQPIIRFQRVSSFRESWRVDGEKLLEGGVVGTLVPLSVLVLQQLHDRSCPLCDCCHGLPKDRVLRQRHACSRHPVNRDIVRKHCSIDETTRVKHNEQNFFTRYEEVQS